jgi:hypothetical protein
VCVVLCPVGSTQGGRTTCWLCCVVVASCRRGAGSNASRNLETREKAEAGLRAGFMQAYAEVLKDTNDDATFESRCLCNTHCRSESLNDLHVYDNGFTIAPAEPTVSIPDLTESLPMRPHKTTSKHNPPPTMTTSCQGQLASARCFCQIHTFTGQGHEMFRCSDQMR